MGVKFNDFFVNKIIGLAGVVLRWWVEICDAIMRVYHIIWSIFYELVAKYPNSGRIQIVFALRKCQYLVNLQCAFILN